MASRSDGLLMANSTSNSSSLGSTCSSVSSPARMRRRSSLATCSASRRNRTVGAVTGRVCQINRASPGPIDRCIQMICVIRSPCEKGSTGVQHWTVGEVRIHTVLQAVIPIPPARLFANAPARLPAVLAPDYVDASGNILMAIQSYLIESAAACVLVDTCFGESFLRSRDIPDRFEESLAATGFQPRDISTVVCTHLHRDHAGRNTVAQAGRWVPAFPDAEYLVTAAEHEHWREFTGEDRAPSECVAPLQEHGRLRLVASDHRVTEEIRLVPTAGHTPGHVSVRIESGGSARLDGGEAKLGPPHEPSGSARLDGGEAKLGPPHEPGGSARLDGGEAKLGPPHEPSGSARLDGGEAKLGPPHQPGGSGGVAGVTWKRFAETGVIKAKSVVIAAGGFVMNPEMVARHTPKLAEKPFVLGNTYDDGLGIRLGMSVGGATKHMDQVFVTAPVYPPSILLTGIIVNKDGKRFVAEDSYHSRTSGFVMDQPGSVAFLIVDETHLRKPQVPLVPLIDGWETVPEMEAALGIPAGNLVETLDHHNACAARGEDPDFHKQPEFLAPQDSGPWGAFDLSLGKAMYAGFTVGGLATSMDGEVLRDDGRPVPGLYAAGACAANIAQDGKGYASGTQLGEGSFFGRRAGAHAAAVR